MSVSYSNTTRKVYSFVDFINSIKNLKSLSLKTKNLKRNFMLKEIPEYFCDDYEGNYEICVLEPRNRCYY